LNRIRASQKGGTTAKNGNIRRRTRKKDRLIYHRGVGGGGGRGTAEQDVVTKANWEKGSSNNKGRGLYGKMGKVEERSLTKGGVVGRDIRG